MLSTMRELSPFLVLGAFLALILLTPFPVSSQNQTRTQLDLARVCVGEAGFDVDNRGDCGAIIHLLTRRAESQGISVRTMARHYSGRHAGHEASPRPWVSGLSLDGSTPAGWPETSPPFSRYRADWLGVLAYVGHALRGAVLDPCPGSDHWGGTMDDHRGVAAGWTRVECDMPTLNHFWTVD